MEKACIPKQILKIIEAKCKDNPKVYWHGSASGNLCGGSSGLHLGTEKAAKIALEARIGIPANGKGWRGDKEYGKTLLAGQKTLHKLDPKGFNVTGINVEAPKEDYYPKNFIEENKKFAEQLTYPDGTKMPLDVKPSVDPFVIVGDMTNTPSKPHGDWKANAYMRSNLKKGTAKRGYFYTNIGEDEGSISVVVPNGNHLARVKCKT